MIVTLTEGADPGAVRDALTGLGLWVVPLRGRRGPGQFLVRPFSGDVERARVLALPGVEDVLAPASRHPLVDGAPATVRVGGVRLGEGETPVLMAGPCAVESERSIHDAATRVAAAGGRFLRGGAFKPRSSPHDFQGLGTEALRWLREAADAQGLGVVTEAVSEASVEAVAAVADLVQIGSRNMHNSTLLAAAGRAGRPVLVKRGMAATVEEWLLAGEYCLAAGAPAVVFCERGIRSFDDRTRNLLDLASVALLRHVHRVPVIVDPSHALGRRDLVPPLARAAIAAGAAGLLVEVHPDPAHARSDGPQALSFDELALLARALAAPESAAAPLPG
ncbi:MAG: 3-deoxy-7-phosphoheptulonate synthase [Gemmatimonadota bacterium]|nr:3-deoxy-7-phosphoheptulonate synthase [Gemmatimonadota bacterium]